MAEEPPPDLLGVTKTLLPVYKGDTRRKVAYRLTPINQEPEKPTRKIRFEPEEEPPAKPRKKPLPENMVQALDRLPRLVGSIVRDVAADPETNYGINETMRRWSDFGSPEKAMLVGAYLDPASRRRVNELLDGAWRGNENIFSVDEIVVGSGLHAAIYTAVRASMGFPAPLVLEGREKVGGSFALGGASFYMNSRNRPGPLSIPGERGALNIIPGSIIQPSDLGGEEYQTNEVMAWVIRNTLAMHADVMPFSRVTGITQKDGKVEVVLKDGRKINARRVIIATGIGLPKNSTTVDNNRVICFDQFMQMLGQPFPLKGMRRVAVLGGGDGGKTAIEALTGQGPNAMSVASVDWPEMIDWYGAPWKNCTDCITKARIRYKRLASLLPDPLRPGRPYRVRPFERSNVISAGFEVVYVNQMPYDYLIDCTGYVTNTLLLDRKLSQALAVVNEIRVGARLGSEIYVVGPASDLEVADSEKEVLRNIDENKTSMFRYAPRTAALAAALD